MINFTERQKGIRAQILSLNKTEAKFQKQITKLQQEVGKLKDQKLQLINENYKILNSQKEELLRSKVPEQKLKAQILKLPKNKKIALLKLFLETEKKPETIK